MFHKVIIILAVYHCKFEIKLNKEWVASSYGFGVDCLDKLTSPWGSQGLSRYPSMPVPWGFLDWVLVCKWLLALAHSIHSQLLECGTLRHSQQLAVSLVWPKLTFCQCLSLLGRYWKHCNKGWRSADKKSVVHHLAPTLWLPKRALCLWVSW